MKPAFSLLSAFSTLLTAQVFAATLTPAGAGLTADEQTLHDAALSGNRLTSSHHCFVPRDAGKAVVVFGVGEGAGLGSRASFPTTIASVASCTALLAATPPAGGSALRIDFGTDDWAAFAAMAQETGAVDFGNARIMLATPGDRFNTVRTLTVRNTAWTGKGAYIAMGEGGAASDSGNQFTFAAQGFRLDGAITFDGEYASYGKDQYNMRALSSTGIKGLFIGPDILVTGAKGACYGSRGNTDEHVAGRFEHCGDFWHVVKAPTDPQFGRPFGVWQEDVHGHLDDRGLRVRFAAQSGLFIQSSDPVATMTLAGSRIENSGYYNYDLEEWAGTEDIGGITSIQDPAARRDYSHTYGGVDLSNTRHIVFGAVNIFGSNGNDFVLNPQDGDEFAFQSMVGGTIRAVSGPNVAQASNVYLSQIGGHTQKVTIGTITADILTVYPGGGGEKNAAAPGDNGIWIGEFSSPGKYAAGPNLALTNYRGGYNMVSIRKGQAATVTLNSAAGPVLLDVGPGFHFRNVTTEGGKGAWIGDVQRIGVKPCNGPEPCNFSLSRWLAAARHVDR